MDAASQGAITAVFLVANIGATLIAVLAFIAFINGILVRFSNLTVPGNCSLFCKILLNYLTHNLIFKIALGHG